MHSHTAVFLSTPLSPMPQIAVHAGNPNLKQVKAQHKLAGSDLDSLNYVLTPNTKHPGHSKEYRESDIIALAARLKSLPASPPNGPHIIRSHAMQQYDLKDEQMNRIHPVGSGPNPHGGDRVVRYYNVSDVEALVRAIQEAGRP
ncbi:hypothetical protein DFH07DRAFT_20556 [Mycena maculata]|uniref:Uncharacterized protein n=1 Tax=Mycena maculata TaxID=230809 RepID=A0AAD7IK95_9AGAR|nr:hypothetical protein DFH07DRAFT_20556 [Mycena maculata]